MDELERIRAGLENTRSVIYEYSQHSDKFEWAGDVAALIGLKSAGASHKSPSSLLSYIHEEDKEDYRKAFQQTLKEKKPFNLEYRITRPDGQVVWIEDRAKVVKNGKDHVLVGMIRQVESRDQGYSDGEYSFKPIFIKNLDSSIRCAIEKGTEGCFLKVAVTNLSTVVSWYGKQIADQVMSEMIEKIRKYIKSDDIISRVYIDQIGIILKQAPSEEVSSIVRHIDDFIRNYRAEWVEEPITFRCLIGGVYFPTNANSAEEAIHRAYIALSSARDPAAMSNYCDYKEAEASQTYSKNQIGIMHYMRNAVHQDKLRLAYQPIIESKTGKTNWYECLLRIVDEKGRISSAGGIIPIAEKMGFIDIVDQFVLEKVIQELDASKDISFTFNVSNLTTDSPKWLAMCTRMLAGREDIASRIIVEITETAAQRDLRQTAYFVASLQALGCKVALDDFGAGYTSFRQLKSLSVDMVKIDGTFVADLAENSENLLFIKTLIDFNNCYGLKTIAECVETGEVAKILMEINVDYMQGYYFGKPSTKRPWRGE
jgi:diguanylate cyclase (GGDEF)-like protein/PAS domain S-box-containing protein